MKKILKAKVIEIESELVQEMIIFSNIFSLDLEPGNIIRISGCQHKILEIEEFTTMEEIVDFIKERADESMHSFLHRNNVDWGGLRNARIVKSEEEIENTIDYADVLEFE